MESFINESNLLIKMKRIPDDLKRLAEFLAGDRLAIKDTIEDTIGGPIELIRQGEELLEPIVLNEPSKLLQS